MVSLLLLKNYNLATIIQKEIEAEGWFIDEIENVCALMLSYRIHKEKVGLERFSKDTTKTAQAINQLIARGVEVLTCFNI